jgi:small-conductance mechanosensitive channel
MIAPLLRRLLLVLVLLVALGQAGPVAAQDALKADDYKTFDTTVSQIEDVVVKAQVDDERLSNMRAEMVKWRSTFSAAQGSNADQIATAKNQIAALGPVPAEGQTEDAMIAKRRVELSAELAKLQAPVLTATEATTRADSTIASIDKLIRERHADKLLRLSPSALNPVNWPTAVSMFRWMGQWIWDETRWRFTRPMNVDQLRDNAPLIVVLVLAALLLLVRGGRWMRRLTTWLLSKTQMRGRNLISGIMSLGQVALPVAGAVLLYMALERASLFGPIILSLFSALPAVVLVIFLTRWLAHHVFPADPDQESAIGLGPEDRAEGRLQAVLLGVSVALYDLVATWIVPRAANFLGGAASNIAADRAQQVAQATDAAISVIVVPLQVFAAVALYRLGQILRRQSAAGRSGGEGAFRFELIYWVSSAAIAIAVVAPALGLIGYVSAANALIWPAINTLSLFAMVVVVQGFFAELYVTVARTPEARHDGLMPIIAGLVITCAALPLLALIWGARVVDLVDLWTSFRSGVSLGGVRISPTNFIVLVAVFGVSYAVTRLVQGGLKSSILPRTSLDQGGRNAIVSGVGYAGVFLSALLAITAAGIDLSGFALVASALSIGIGFGLQTIVSNFVSGVILLVERPVSEGDWIEVGTTTGIVKSISVRSTRIQTFDRSDVIVPNSDLISGAVTNFTRFNMSGRLIVPVGVAFGSDTRRVDQVLREIAEAQPLVVLNPPPVIALIGFGADSINFEIRMILRDVNFSLEVRSEINHEIVRCFAENKIEIPFTQQDIHLRNVDELAAALRELQKIGILPPAQGKPDV